MAEIALYLDNKVFLLFCSGPSCMKNYAYDVFFHLNDSEALSHLHVVQS